MFSDRAVVHVRAGRGGDGSIAFRREKFVPKGGPAGGDGGRGGDVTFVADPDIRDLSTLRFRPHVRADAGRHGEGSDRTGATGGETVVRVPVGTQVFGVDGVLLCDLAHAGARAVVARGGRGGQGNRRFATPTRQSPRVAEVGEEGDERTLELRLKLLADAALLGFPNVGKSSLLRRLSNATPKVADYPFTTIDPVLGTVDAPDGRQLTVVDVPGLLEGASEGVGLGHAFLAHLERARLLLHTLDASAPLEEARAAFGTIYRELVAHGHGLASRPRLVILNKIDLLPPEEREARIAAFAAAVAGSDEEPDRSVVRTDDGAPVVLGVSCATGEGIDALVAALFQYVPEAAPDELMLEPELVDYLVYRPGSERGARFRIFREEGALRVASADLEAQLETLDAGNDADVADLTRRLESLGVVDALKRAGARDGTTVTIGDEQFTYRPKQGLT
jgi:GTP-binding protein